jgi:transcription initiation factor IIE alpha subunit
MPDTITPDQVVEAAKELGKDEFTRDDLASKLGVEQPDLRLGFRRARRAGHLDKVREDEKGTGVFRLTGE